MPQPSPAARLPWLALAAFGLIAALWAGQIRGTISSNDGSNLALARSLGLRHETQLRDEAWRTLNVDLAEREGLLYSDRPPGTAFAAIPATIAGAAIDAARQGEGPSNLWPVSSELYRSTAQVRAPAALRAGALSRTAGTALLLGLHGIAMGLLGLGAIRGILTALGAPPRRQAMVVLGLGLCTAYGAYATLLFSHVSAAAWTWLALWAALVARAGGPRAQSWSALAGLAGAWVIACDYSLVLGVVPALALTLPRQRWVWAIAGASIVAMSVAAYHTAAFGSPFAIGYDFSTNFAFARGRASTFSGSPLTGLNTLFGWGHGAGLLVRSPIVLVGLALALAPLRAGEQHTARAPVNWPRRWLLCFTPWLALLCFHRTPWGGAGQDHRYLIVAIGLAALGIGARSWRPSRALLLCTITLGSGWLFWRGFLSSYELRYVSSPVPAAIVAGVVALGFGIAGLSRAAARRAQADGSPDTGPT